MQRLFFCGFLLCLAAPAVAAQPSKELQAALNHLEDPALKACVSESIAKSGAETVRELTSIKCHSLAIRTVNGLEHFNGLEDISLHNNQIEKFDPAPFVNLKTLNLTKNELRHLECNGLVKLQALYVIANHLERLTLLNLASLEQFKVNRNELVAFDFNGLDSLKKAYLFDNKLEHTSLHLVPGLVYLDVRQNPMPDELYEQMDAIAKVTVLHDGNADDWQ